LVTEYVDRDNDSALRWVKVAEQAAYASGDELCVIKSQRLRAQILFRLGRMAEMISTLQYLEADNQLKRFPDEELTILNLFGVSYLMMGQFDKSLDYLFQTYELARVHHNLDYEAISTQNIGIVYYKLKDYRKGLPFMIKALMMEKGTGRSTAYFTSMNISLCYTQLKDFESAKDYLRESIDLCGKGCDSQSLTHIKYASGCIYLGLNQNDSAEVEFLRSMSYSKEAQDFRMQLDNIYLLSKMYVQASEFSKAERLLKVGESIIQEGIPYNVEMIKVYQQMSELYLSLKKYQEASFYQAKYILLRDSVYDEALTTQLMKIESRFLEQENEARISAQNQLLALKENDIQRQQLVNVLTFALLAASVGLVALTFRNYKEKKGLNILLERKIADRTRELQASHENLSVAFHEKDLEHGRLFRDISDGLRRISGICTVALHESSQASNHSCIQRIDSTTTQLSRILESHFHQGRSLSAH
jgi:tetratricopeptide (TPR) repeat protein